MDERRVVYVLRSEREPARYYVGLTADVRSRLADHNAGESAHTAKYRPWRLAVSIEFETQEGSVRRSVNTPRSRDEIGTMRAVLVFDFTASITNSRRSRSTSFHWSVNTSPTRHAVSSSVITIPLR